MSFQTNFRAQDMLGTKKPVVKKAAPKYVPPVVKTEPVLEVEPERVQDPVLDEKTPI